MLAIANPRRGVKTIVIRYCRKMESGENVLKIHKEIQGARATAADSGDVNSFLKSVLVEVATENYRQLMFETLVFDGTASQKQKNVLYVDPPLRATERVISGLFSNAISRVASRSRPEARIDRTDLQITLDVLEDESEDGKIIKSAGRVDYLAWYGHRTIAIELKRSAMSFDGEKATDSVKKRWDKVVEQAQDAQGALRALCKKDRIRYPNPVSLALMVIVAGRKISLDRIKEYEDEDEEKGKGIDEMRDTFMEGIAGLKGTFMASYTFPEEYRTLAVRRKGHPVSGERNVHYVPFVAFVAKPVVNRQS